MFCSAFEVSAMGAFSMQVLSPWRSRGGSCQRAECDSLVPVHLDEQTELWGAWRSSTGLHLREVHRNIPGNLLHHSPGAIAMAGQNHTAMSFADKHGYLYLL